MVKGTNDLGTVVDSFSFVGGLIAGIAGTLLTAAIGLGGMVEHELYWGIGGIVACIGGIIFSLRTPRQIELHEHGFVLVRGFSGEAVHWTEVTSTTALEGGEIGRMKKLDHFDPL